MLNPEYNKTFRCNNSLLNYIWVSFLSPRLCNSLKRLILQKDEPLCPFMTFFFFLSAFFWMSDGTGISPPPRSSVSLLFSVFGWARSAPAVAESCPVETGAWAGPCDSWVQIESRSLDLWGLRDVGAEHVRVGQASYGPQCLGFYGGSRLRWQNILKSYF